MPIILVSRQNEASQTILRRLVANHAFKAITPLSHENAAYPRWSDGANTLLEFDAPITNSDFLSFLESDLFVFASTHKAESGKPCLTVHANGNWGDAKLGGSPRTLNPTSSRAIQAAFESLQSDPAEGFAVSLEAAHHGPTSFTSPTIWAELGSTPAEWGNEEGAESVARAILAACRDWQTKTDDKVALGFGGTHYCPKFGELENNGFAFSFIAPKHALPFVTAERVREAIEKTREKVACAVIDWKGCGAAERARVIDCIEQAGLPWERA